MASHRVHPEHIVQATVVGDEPDLNKMLETLSDNIVKALLARSPSIASADSPACAHTGAQASNLHMSSGAWASPYAIAFGPNPIIPNCSRFMIESTDVKNIYNYRSGKRIFRTVFFGLDRKNNEFIIQNNLSICFDDGGINDSKPNDRYFNGNVSERDFHRFLTMIEPVFYENRDLTKKSFLNPRAFYEAKYGNN